MPDKTRDIADEPAGSAEKLIQATLTAWGRSGAGELSARNLTAAAGLRASSIHYHFGGLGHLLEAAQADAIAAARTWCEEQWVAIGEAARSPVMLGPLLACLIDDWCERNRRLAFAWREGQLMALRGPGSAASAAQWDKVWRDFFERLCAQMEIPQFATLTAWFFDGASALHMLRWRRPLDRAALEELCDGWAAWIEGELAPRSQWFASGQADAETLEMPAEVADPATRAIADAAAQTVAEHGVAALTHRAVAAKAGATLGTVSHKYRTSGDLLRAAFDAIYRRMLARAPMPPQEYGSMTIEEAVAALERGVPAHADLLGSDELFVATARNPDFAAFAAQLRYLRGRSSGRLLQAILGSERPVSAIDGAILSALLGGRSRAWHCASRAADGKDGEGDFAPLLAGFGAR